MSLPDDFIPINTTYGSGEPVEPEILEHIRESYADVGVRFDWRKADIMLITMSSPPTAVNPSKAIAVFLSGWGRHRQVARAA